MFDAIGTAAPYLVLLPFMFYFLTLRRKSRSRLPHPPGPPGFPIVGNTQLPSGQAWKVYREWSDSYASDVVRVNVFGTNIVVLNSLEACIELLDKRSTIYSDRPGEAMTMMDLSGWKWVMVVLRYGTFWRDTRRVLQRQVHPQIIHRYRSIETKSAHEFLRNLLTTPEDFYEHIKRIIGRQALHTAYGVDVQERGDTMIKTAEHALEAVVASMTPGQFLVDVIPILRYIPKWFPGAGFQRQARLWRESAEKMVERPLALSRELLARGELSDDCAAKYLLTEALPEGNYAGYKEEVIRATLASMYSASIDTSVSTLQTFFLAMVLFPEVQTGARKHIDRICKGRLPDFSDHDSLPYMHAVVKEVLRWNQVTPLSVVHVSTQDDVYQNYFIPKETYVLPNTWAIMHDPDVYPEPDTFNPGRFLRMNAAGNLELNPDVRDPEEVIFGFGRRVCPGRYMILESLWITIACILAVFDISKAKRPDGTVITPQGNYTAGFMSFPEPFVCSIRARSAEHEQLILDTAKHDL